MKLISAMLVVKDINQSVDFYETVLGLKNHIGFRRKQNVVGRIGVANARFV